MSNFAKHFTNMFVKNASVSACSSCDAVNTTAAGFDFVNFTDTVLAVSVLLCSILSIISITLIDLIYIIILAGVIISLILKKPNY